MINNKKDRALVLFNRLWRDVERGVYGKMAKIDPTWSRDRRGYWNFKQWFDSQPLVKSPYITKDFKLKSDWFSPETCLLVPRRLHDWIYYNLIISGPIETKGHDSYVVSLTYSSNKSRTEFNNKADAESYVREQAEKYFSSYVPEMSRTCPNFMEQMLRFVEVALAGGRPFVFYSRKVLRHSGIKPNRKTERLSVHDL